jgi:hypothetical protein
MGRDVVGAGVGAAVASAGVVRTCVTASGGAVAGAAGHGVRVATQFKDAITLEMKMEHRVKVMGDRSRVGAN